MLGALHSAQRAMFVYICGVHSANKNWSLFVQFAVHGADDVMHGTYNASCNCAYNALFDGAYYQVWWEERAEPH